MVFSILMSLSVHSNFLVFFLKISLDLLNVNLCFLDIVQEDSKDKKSQVITWNWNLWTAHSIWFFKTLKECQWTVYQEDLVFDVQNYVPVSLMTCWLWKCLQEWCIPFAICSPRWSENKIVAERAIDVWENIVKTVNLWMELPESEQPREDKSCYDLKSAI